MLAPPPDRSWARRQAADHLGIRELIRNFDPPTPSTRLDRLGELADEFAQLRGSERRSLARSFRGDLDWIVAKALEKDRTRRYATAAEFAADISRHLRSEPVSAGAPGAIYRLRKLTRRHRWASIGGSAILLTLVVGAYISTVQYWEAEANAKLADQSAKFAAEKELTAAKSEADARESTDLAEKRLASWLRLADTQRLKDYEAEARELWPCRPEKVAAMEAWLVRARELAARASIHRDALRSLLSQSDGGTTASKPHFQGAELRWQFDLLKALIDGLERFTTPNPRVGSIASVKARWITARSIYRRSIEEHRNSWNDAMQSIADVNECPAYEGLQIQEQVGLVPIGKDPASGLWEFAHLESGEVPRRIDGRLEIVRESSLIFVLLPKAKFVMGAARPTPGGAESGANVDPLALEDEAPVHELTLDSFFLSKFEMTKGQWYRLTGEDDTLYGSEILDSERGYTWLHPIERVSWTRSVEELRRLGLRLPTEAQWEFASRAGSVEPWPSGVRRESLKGSANLCDRSCKRAPGTRGWRFDDWLDDGARTLAMIGSYQPSRFGLHDTIGNVAEWCLDVYGSYELAASPGTGRARAGDRERAASRLPRRRLAYKIR